MSAAKARASLEVVKPGRMSALFDSSARQHGLTGALIHRGG